MMSILRLLMNALHMSLVQFSRQKTRRSLFVAQIPCRVLHLFSPLDFAVGAL
jgi:hypothetical protein